MFYNLRTKYDFERGILEWQVAGVAHYEVWNGFWFNNLAVFAALRRSVPVDVVYVEVAVNSACWYVATSHVKFPVHRRLPIGRPSYFNSEKLCTLNPHFVQ